jgi:hypothetical protein
MILQILRVLLATLAIAFVGTALGQSTGNMRALIAPNAAIDGPTYEEYQRCIAAVPLDQELKKVAAAREACREKAMRAAYQTAPPPNATRTENRSAGVPSVRARADFQQQKLERCSTSSCR